MNTLRPLASHLNYRTLAGLAALTLLGTATHAAPLRVAVVDIAPYAMTEADGRALGQYPDLTRQIVAQAELEAEITVVSCQRAAELLAAGQTDVVVSPAAAALRQVAQPVATVAYLDTVVVTRAGTLPSNQTVGQVRGDCLNAATAGMRPVTLDSLHDGVRMLAAQQVDGLAISREAFFHYANLNRLSAQQWGAMLPAGRQMVWLYAAKQLPAATSEALERSIVQLKQAKKARSTSLALAQNMLVE